VLTFLDVLARHGLACAKKGPSPCKGDRSVCRANAGAYLGKDWPTCPVRAAMDDTRLQLVLQLETASRVGPIDGWPHGFAAWVGPLWGQLQAALNDRTIDTTSEATHAH